MFELASCHRPRRPAEWTESKAIAFIVTLAGTGTVTLAAREAGMSRKSAYALKQRDPLFASSWEKAKRIAAKYRGTKAEGNGRRAAAPSTSSSRSAARVADRPGSEHGDPRLVRRQFVGESSRTLNSHALAPRLPRQ